MAPLTIRWTKQAIADLDHAFDFVATDSPDAARLLIDTVDRATDTPAVHLQLGRPARIPGTRELVVPRTPYIVAYRLDRGTIAILAVIHGARRWPERF